MGTWASFIQKLMGKNQTKDVAKERLKLVLFHDRTEIPPALVDVIKDEIIAVLDKYLDIDKEKMDVELTKLGEESRSSTSALVANIPVRGVKSTKKIQ
jgi:cell division topological specificity factor